MKNQELIANLFRTEFSKIVAVLCKTYGISNIQFAEDIVSDTFLIATETWKLKGVPLYPEAWLYSVAKNKTKDAFKHNKIFIKKIKPELEHLGYQQTLDPDFSNKNITDSQLQMLFAICNPMIKAEAQIALALRILCGFGINEIATAFLTTKSTVNKRLVRAKDTLRKNNINLSFSENEDLYGRIDSVLSIIYLLFNEGYYSVSSEQQILKKELCLEAMRLNFMLIENKSTNLPKVNALMALFCFHSARFDQRINKKGEIVLYDDQEKDKWDATLIEKGSFYLNKSAKGEITKYHLEAGISYWHTKLANNKNKWENILQLYNQLLQIEYSPITALNRTYALAKANSKEEAIAEALKIDLNENHLYHSLLAELYIGIDKSKQLRHLKEAMNLVKTEAERKIIDNKWKKACREQSI